MTKENFAKIRRNQIRLDSCKQHCFITEGLKFGFGAMVKCKHCLGEMEIVKANQYVRGFVAAGGDSSLVWAGWKDEGKKEIDTCCPYCLAEKVSVPHCRLCGGRGHVTLSEARKYFVERGIWGVT